MLIRNFCVISFEGSLLKAFKHKFKVTPKGGDKYEQDFLAHQHPYITNR